MRSVVAASAIMLTLTVVGATPAQPATADPVSSRVFSDAARDIPSGVDLLRARGTNRGKVTITTRHRDLQRQSSYSFTIYLDTRTSHPGPEYAISGGLSAGTDWFTGRATRTWRIYGDPLDEIGTCNSAVSINYETETLRVTLGRDCLGGHPGRVRVAIAVGDGKHSDFGPAKKTFYRWIARG